MKTWQIFLKCILGGLFMSAFSYEMVAAIAPLVNPQFSTGDFDFKASVVFGAIFGFIIFMVMDLYYRLGEESNLADNKP